MCYYRTSYTSGPPRMTELSATELRRRRKQLLRKLPPLDTVLRGSLIERYKRCGNPRCKCANGPGHGPKYYLSVSHAGQSPQMDYVPQAEHAVVSQYLANYSLVREILEEISQINHQLLRRRQPL
jgi:hypothetical protein